MLEISNDTISYNVGSFTNHQDRVIIDVIKKLPGMDVDQHGKISYNGKAISNLYIDGDNILDDRYNLATNSLPVSMVDKIQLLQNDQPIKILKNITSSDNIALNLSLKDSARTRLFGQAKIGAGIEGVEENDITGMIFKKKIKFINSFKINNSGNNLQEEVMEQNQSDYLARIEKIPVKPIINLGVNVPADLTKQRYLFNNALLVNTNTLINLKKDIRLKTNIYYLKDKQNNTFQSLTNIYLLNDTIHYKEHQNSNSELNKIYTQINLNINKPKYYLNNSALINYNAENDEGHILTNGSNVEQHLQNHSVEISNEFSYIKYLSHTNIIEGYSYLDYSKRPESFNVIPGLYNSLLNNNFSYGILNQEIALPTYYNYNLISLIKSHKNISQVFSLGSIFQSQILTTKLNLLQSNNPVNLVSDSFANHAITQEDKFFGKIDNDWTNKSERMKIKFALPFGIYSLSYTDNIRNLRQQTNISFIDPQLGIKYTFNDANSLSARFSIETRPNSIDDEYKGFLLTNYRTFVNNEDINTINKRSNLILGYNHRNNLKLKYFNCSLIYGLLKSPTLISDTISDDLDIASRILLPNTIKRLELISSLSKYYFQLHTTVKISAAGSFNTQNILQNNHLLLVKNNSYNVDGSINSRINNKLNTNYSVFIQVNKNISTQEIQSSKNIFRQSYFSFRQQLDVNYSLTKACDLKLNTEEYYSNYDLGSNKNYFFLDAFLKYKILKIHADIDLDYLNALNVKNYLFTSALGNTFIQNSYSIRPRMIMLKCSFNF